MKRLFYTLAVLLIFTTCIKSQWVNQNVIPDPPPLYSVYALNNNVAYACGDSGKVLFTTNGGTNWTYITSFLFGVRQAFSVHALNQTTALVVCNSGPTGLIFKTTNSGSQWFPVHQRNGGIIYDVEFYNPQSGYAYGNPSLSRWYIIRTTDGGNSWDTTMPRPIADSPNDMGFPNALTTIFFGQPYIWFGTSVMKIFYSFNGGAIWNFGFTPSSQPSFGITFLDQSTGFAGGLIGFKSTNSGQNWVQWAPIQVVGPVYSVANAGGKIWYASGPHIYCSTNGGNSFFVQHTSPDNSIYLHLSMTFVASDNLMSIITGWGVTNDGVISHYNETVGIQQIGSSVPESFKLEQNYPNPFNPITHFRFRIADLEFISLKIYDILGKEIAVLVNGKMKPGIYEADWDASNYPSGVYFYTLKAGSFSETRKMVFVK
ncbi:MAG TPA: T9SS type A sorting domain-containing protein [Ignavibacteria bacterium]